MAAASFQADLKAAREAANVSLEAIQLETRVPADVVKRLETGALFDDPSFNDVYLRALLRSYATAVGLSPSAVLDAFKAAQDGTYRGELQPGFDRSAPEAQPAVEPPDSPATPPVPAEANPVSAPDGGEVAKSETVPPKAPETPTTSATPAPAVAALSKPAPAPSKAAPAPVAPPKEKQRVASQAAANAPRSFDRSWGAILGVTAVVTVAVVAVLWMLFRTDAPEPEEQQVVAADTAAVQDFLTDDTTSVATAETPPPPSNAPRFQLPISVTVRAKSSGDGLQNFRVTEVPDSRRPYWMNPGVEQTFESSEGLIVWGEGAEGMNPEEVTLVWEGLEFDPARGSILRITPENGQRLLDSLSTARSRPN